MTNNHYDWIERFLRSPRIDDIELLESDSITVAGNTVSLGGSTDVNHTDLSSISSDDHHTRYSDEEAQDAIAGSFLLAGNALNKEYLDDENSLTLEVATSSIQTNELDESITPTWVNEHTFSGGITGLPEPNRDSDAARKSYVDSVSEGLEIKGSVRASANSNIDLSSTADPNPVDGVTLSDSDRILLKNQTDKTENGIYVTSTANDPTTWVRSNDADEDSEVTSGLFVFVESGDTFASQGFVLTTSDPITLGTTELSFTQFSGAESFTAGDGITQENNTISHSDTSTQTDVSSSAGSAITELTFDNFGHVTTASSSSFDSRYLNKSGDSLTGELDLNSNDLIDGTATIWDTTSSYVPQSSIEQGAGSNLDADTVDGFEAAELGLDIEDGGSTTVSNSVGLNFTDNLAVTNDGDNTASITLQQGAGSNLDADTVDGFEASDLGLDIEDGGSITVSNSVGLNFTDNLAVTNDGDNTASITLQQGSGSGLDADLLQGNVPSDFAASNHGNEEHNTNFTTLAEVNNNADVPNADFADEAGNADTLDGNDSTDFYQPDGNDRLIVETRTTDPSVLSDGRVWIRTDL